MFSIKWNLRIMYISFSDGSDENPQSIYVLSKTKT